MGIGDKNLLTFRTGNFYSLTHFNLLATLSLPSPCQGEGKGEG